MDKKSIEDRLNTFRLKGIDESDHARWDGHMCARAFRSSHDMYFQDHEDEEDDDWPEFVGKDIVLKAAKAHFDGFPVKVSVVDDEKHWFRVIVDVTEQKNTVKDKTVTSTAKQKEDTMSTSTVAKSLKDEVVSIIHEREERIKREAKFLADQVIQNKQKILDAAKDMRYHEWIKVKLNEMSGKEVAIHDVGNKLKSIMKCNGLDGFELSFIKIEEGSMGIEVSFVPKKKEK